MLKILKTPAVIAALIWFGILSVMAMVNITEARVYYGPAALLGTDEVTSKMIKNLDVINQDISATAYISSSKITFSTNYGLASSTWATILDRLASLSTTSNNFIIADGTTWNATSGANARTAMGLGTIATQNSNAVSITGGSITGITDLGTADGGTGQSWDTVATGSIPYFSSGGVMSTLAPGTSGQFLKTQGANANPAWGAGGAVWNVGDIKLQEAASSTQTATTTYQKRAAIQISRDGALRIKFDLATDNTGDTAYGRIYRNGTAVGTERSKGVGWATFSEDITGWTAGDFVQLYIKGSGTYYVSNSRNFGIYVDGTSSTTATYY